LLLTIEHNEKIVHDGLPIGRCKYIAHRNTLLNASSIFPSLLNQTVISAAHSSTVCSSALRSSTSRIIGIRVRILDTSFSKTASPWKSLLLSFHASISSLRVRECWSLTGRSGSSGAPSYRIPRPQRSPHDSVAYAQIC